MVHSAALLGAAFVFACLPDAAISGGDPPAKIVGLRPSADVVSDAAVAVAISRPVTLAASEWPIEVTRANGPEAIPIAVSMSAGGRELRLAPRPSWPPGERMLVHVGAGLVDVSGRPLILPATSLPFDTRADAQAPPVLTVRSPPPGRAAPLNLSSLSVSLLPPRSDVERVLLVSERERVPAAVERISEDGTILARLPDHQGPCDPLCMDTRYRIEIEGQSLLAVPGPRGEIRTATVTDDVPPVVTATSVLFHGDQVIIQLEASEPVIVRGMVFQRALEQEQEESEALRLPLIASACVFIEPFSPLAPDTDYVFRLEGEDVAGNRLRAVEIPVRTVPRIDVAISEVVPAPMHDWNDSDGSGDPFDPHPGVGAVSAADEWVELVNLSSVPVEIESAGIVLRVLDTSPAETALDGAPYLHFGDGGSRSAWWPGEALVVHPRGSMAQRGFVLELTSGTRVLDRLVVGDGPDAVQRRAAPPDLHHESLARDVRGTFRWCAPTPGDPLPSSDCL